MRNFLKILRYFPSPFVILWLLLYIIFDKILLSNSVAPDQMPHYVAYDQGLHCLPMTLYGIPSKNGLIVTSSDLYCLHIMALNET